MPEAAAESEPDGVDAVPQDRPRPTPTLAGASPDADLAVGSEATTVPEPWYSESEPGPEPQPAPERTAQIEAPPAPTNEPVTSHPLVRDLLLSPESWLIWPAVAVMRWMTRAASSRVRRIRYASKPSLSFAPGEVDDVSIDTNGIRLVLHGPGFASAGSPLPTSDIARIIEDQTKGGGIADWLDGPIDRLMQALEASHARSNVAFGLATGDKEIRTLRNVSEIVGQSAPLWGNADGELRDAWRRPASGAVGLSSFFLGNITAVGLEDLMRSYTRMPVRVEEFAGGEVKVLHPVMIGRPIGTALLGANCKLAAAGVNVVLEGGTDPDALKWACEGVRRRTLRRAAASYVGSDSPEIHVYLEMDASAVPPAALGGRTGLHAGAVLGQGTGVVRLPISTPRGASGSPPPGA